MDRDMKITLAIIGTAIALCAVVTVYFMFIVPQAAVNETKMNQNLVPIMPSIMDVTAGVDGQSYSGNWGEMLQSYGRDMSFWTDEDLNVYFGTYFDFEANSARNQADRPGLRLEGGTWSQNRNEVTILYSSTYDFRQLIEFEMGNVSKYESKLVLRCIDKSCHELVGDDGVAYHFFFNNTEAIGGDNLTYTPAHGNASGAP